MALSIQLNKSNPTNFRIVFPILPSEISAYGTKELSLNVHGSVIPGVQIEQGQNNYQATKTNYSMGPMVFDAWNVDFIIDSELKNWRILFDWMTYINNNKDKMMEEASKYQVDASVLILDNFNNEVLRLAFIGVWPTSIGEITLSYRDDAPILESNVTFSYDYFEIK
jgi:hypothetical protein